MSEQDKVQPYKPEEPADKATIKRDQKEIREAAKHAAQKQAAEELGKNDPPMSREQAEKEIREAARKVQQEKK